MADDGPDPSTGTTDHALVRLVLIVDDHPMIAEAVRSYLEANLLDVRAVATTSWEDASRRDDMPDLVLLDLHLGREEQGRLATLRAAIERFAPRPVAVFSGDVTSARARECLDAGARGFLPKTLRGPAFAAAVELLLAGERFVPEVLLGTEAGHGSRVAPASRLSERERLILEQLALGLSNKEIAYRVGLTEGTVKQYLNTIFRKLDVRTRTQAAAIFLKGGFEK